MNIVKKYPPKIYHSIDINHAFKIAASKKFATLIITTNPNTSTNTNIDTNNNIDMDAVFIPFYTQFF